ncbi:MAG: energy-coupling factor transporter ATPase [Oscillospiraceae bacterium]|nr:energy-coupling factor transporter ATPase [Oscillospiraceae bacterium]
MSLLQTENLSYIYGEGTPFCVTALDKVNIEIEKGEIVAVIGHTGSGKSTLMQQLNGLLKPTSGRVLIDGEDIRSSKAKTLETRFRVGLCFQYPEYQLFENTVYEDIAFGPKNMGLTEAEVDKRVRDAAKYVGIPEVAFKTHPFDLSGGEKRRVAIAGVISMEPEVLILDEPTSGLDPKGREQILSLIKNYRDRTGKTVVIVSHSMNDVAKIASKVIVMYNSKVLMTGTVDEVFEQSEKLTEIGLSVPQITEVFAKLHAKGYPVSEKVYTVEQAYLEIKRVLTGGEANA